VIDNSVLREITNANLNAPAIVIGEKVSANVYDKIAMHQFFRWLDEL